jgi:CheY-like chemotaxis protein
MQSSGLLSSRQGNSNQSQTEPARATRFSGQRALLTARLLWLGMGMLGTAKNERRALALRHAGWMTHRLAVREHAPLTISVKLKGPLRFGPLPSPIRRMHARCRLVRCRMPSPRRGSGARDISNCRRVLVVDDDSDSADLLELLLERAGHQVCVANGAIAALALVEGFRPQIALIDIGLPDMDGYELLAALQGKPELEACRFIAVTGYSSLGLKARSERAGFYAHLTKPLDFEELEIALAYTGQSTNDKSG